MIVTTITLDQESALTMSIALNKIADLTFALQAISDSLMDKEELIYGAAIKGLSDSIRTFANEACAEIDHELGYTGQEEED